MIEHQEYSASEFIDQIKQLISEITLSVMRDSSNRRIIADQTSALPAAEGKDTKPAKKTKSSAKKNKDKKE